ncbi:MAG: DUF7948 domain-containing protein, partial [Chitinophagaceae bacterium]
MTSLKPYIFFIAFLASAIPVISQDYNNIEFIENKGQWEGPVKFKGEVNAGAVFIRSAGFTILQHNQQDWAALQSMYGHGHQPSPGTISSRSDGRFVLRSHSYNIDFVGASPTMQVIPDKVIPTYNNYFLGSDPSRWASDCRIYQAITLKDVYPNIDVRYYTYNGMLKYDIIAKPGADISKIALKYEGVDKLQVKNKELVIGTSVGELKESYPYTYQSKGKERTEINCKYKVKDNIVRFDVKGYDPSATLVIDPTLLFCSFANSTADNWGYTATYGPDGSFYGGGVVYGGNSWPVSTGAFQTVFQSGIDESGMRASDIGIIKLSPNGGTRLYATYVGGRGNEQPHSLIVDAQGNLVIAGRSKSDTSYPGGRIPIGPGGSYDIVVTKLNAAGTGIIGSRRIGGAADDGVNISPGRSGDASLQQNYGDDGRSEVILDAAGNIYVASSTQSNSANAATKFPTTAGAFQPDFGGGNQDAVVLKFSPDLSAYLFGSYLGGGGTGPGGNDAAYVLALAPSGDIFVAGGTESSSFPGNHANTVGVSSHGGIDGFVAQISNNGATLIRSTYIGTTGTDQVYGIQFDRNGFPYVMGQTTGTWPVSPAGIYSETNGKQFIAKLEPDLSAYVYSTAFGSGSTRPNISPTAFLVDRCENVYVSGWGSGMTQEPGPSYPNAGTIGMTITADALQKSTDGRDFYFFVLRRDAAGPGPLYASFFGQSGGYTDHVDGGTSRFDQNGVIYQGVCANCGGGAVFPTTPG